MDQSKKNSHTWLTPSFDFASTEGSNTYKRSSSQMSNNSVTEFKPACSTSQRRNNITCLSTLLAACKPQRPSELAVSRKKQQEISDWLRLKIQEGKPCILVLSGPSGCGKTAALKMLAREIGFNIIEWITPLDQVTDENNMVMRQGEKFEDYFIRATRYKSVLCKYSRRLLLVKDFPNVYMRDKDSFFVLLEKYIQLGNEPVVFICTDTENSKLMQTIFPVNIREQFGIDLISINPVTQTAMKNVLKRVARILNVKADYLVNVTQDIIDEMLFNNNGDIRSTLSNLIFSSLKVPKNQFGSECEGRKENLSIFHGIGRVINSKRVAQGNSWKFVHDPDEIASFFQLQPIVFFRFLHGNYLHTIKGIEEASISADIISLADNFSCEWRDPNLGKVMLSFCVRGLMVTNDAPVSNWIPIRKPYNYEWKIQRDLATAERRWYESLIAPKVKNTQQIFNLTIEDVIE